MKSLRYTKLDRAGAYRSLVRCLTGKRPLENPRLIEKNDMTMGHK
jgi:hypothetical protein